MKIKHSSLFSKPKYYSKNDDKKEESNQLSWMCAVIVLVVTDRAAMATNSSGTSSSSANPAGIASAGAYSTGTSIHLLNCVVTLLFFVV